MLKLDKIAVKRGKRTIFSEISCHIEQGELIALVGENGAGKSTLLHAIAGSLPYLGNISLLDKNLEQWDNFELATKRAVLTQHHNKAFAFGIPELISMGRHLLREPKTHCHKRVNDYIELLELDSLLGRTTQQLSGGELQRVYFAKCLAQLDAFPKSNEQVDNGLMLLDEPTSALDLRHQHRLLQLVKQYCKQHNSAIVAIHDLNLASLYADKVLLLHNGKLHAYGSPENVLTRQNLEAVYQTSMHVTQHPTYDYQMIFSEPKDLSYETRSIS